MASAALAGRLAEPTPEPPDRALRIVVALLLALLLITAGAIIAPLI